MRHETSTLQHLCSLTTNACDDFDTSRNGGRRDVTLLLHLCYLKRIRWDDCVTSYKDAVHESLIEVLG